MKTVYCLRLRADDSEPWGEPAYYPKRSDRDKDATIARCLISLRTWSYEEKKTPEEIESLT